MEVRDRIKILFIHHGTGIGGAPISLLNLVKKLDPVKFEVKVAFVRGGAAEHLFSKNGVRTEVIGSSNIWFTHNETGKIQWRYFYRYITILFHWIDTAFRTAPKYLASQDAQIIHLNSHVLTSWAFAAKRAGKKVVIHNREAVAQGYFGIRRRILQLLIRRNCDRIINISHDNKRRLGIETNSTVIYNFVDLPREYRSPMNGYAPRVLYLGGMARIKGYEVTVDCLKYLNKNVSIQFAGSMGRLSGGGSLRAWFRDFIKLTVFSEKYRPLKKIFASRNAEVIGMLTDPLKVIDASDILITPFKIEHFSRPAIEAFAYGKPVIGSDVEGMDEIIDHGVNGLLVERNNARALAEAINYLCENPEVARRLGESARSKATAVFSPEVNMPKVERIYLDLIHAG